MNSFIVGNIVALIAASLSIILGIIKNREKIIYIQTIQFLIFIISNLILGGFTGAIANIIGVTRNILSYKEKLTKAIILLIIIISIILTLMFNNLGFIGLFPLVNTIIYTLFINEKNPFKFKILLLISFILWFIYDINIKSYASAIFDLVSFITAIFSAYQIYINKKKETQN